jgi:hypothetical protein
MARKALNRLANQLLSRKQGNPAYATARQTHSICMFGTEFRLCPATAHLSKKSVPVQLLERVLFLSRKCTDRDFGIPSYQRKRGKYSVESKLLSPNPRHLSDPAHAQTVWSGLVWPGRVILCLCLSLCPARIDLAATRSEENQRHQQGIHGHGPRQESIAGVSRLTHLNPPILQWIARHGHSTLSRVRSASLFSRGGDTVCLLLLTMGGKADYSVYQGRQCCGTS